MPYDHYIAKTYLKHFLPPSGPFHAYRKSGKPAFHPCWPADICGEMGGDIVPDFLANPKALGEFRALFEPYWNPSLEALRQRRATFGDKGAIAGYVANLLAATPTAKRLALDQCRHLMMEEVRARRRLEARHGVEDAGMDKAIAAMDAGRILINIDENFVRAQNTAHLMSFAQRLYDADWTVIENLTPVDFITSDNPFVFDDPGPFRGGKSAGRLPRFLPLTPKLCLAVEMERETPKRVFDFGTPSLGKLLYATLGERAGVDRVNELVVQCAEEVVISTRPLDALGPLIEKYAKHQVGNQFMTINGPDSVFNGVQLRVWNPAEHKKSLRFPPRAA